MSLQFHNNFVQRASGDPNTLHLGSHGSPTGAGGSGVREVDTPSVVSIKSNKKNISVQRGNYNSLRVNPIKCLLGLTGMASENNTGYTGLVSESFIYPTNFDENRFYNFQIESGASGDVSNCPSGLRFVWTPDEPETYLNESGISSGDSIIYLGERETNISKHFTNSLTESGENFEVAVGLNNVETLTITGLSGSHLVISGSASKSQELGARIVSTNTLHPAPTGETGYAQSFQILIQDNAGGDSKFYVAGSGVTGGCHLGGTFTGSGYTFFETPVIDVYRGFNYFFNQHHASNHDEHIMFSYTSGGAHNAGERISGKYEVEEANSNYCFNNYCNFHCPDETTFMIPIEMESGNKIYYYASGTAGVGGTGYLNVLTSGDGGN